MHLCTQLKIHMYMDLYLRKQGHGYYSIYVEKEKKKRTHKDHIYGPYGYAFFLFLTLSPHIYGALMGMLLFLFLKNEKGEETLKANAPYIWTNGLYTFKLYVICFFLSFLKKEEKGRRECMSVQNKHAYTYI